MSDWQAGDLALCIYMMPGGQDAWEPTVGNVYTVMEIVDGLDADTRKDRVGLELNEDPYPDPIRCWPADWFRKIRPDEHEACEPEFVQLLKRSKTPEPVAVSIVRAHAMSALFDVAAHALKRGDFTAFDEAMARFKKIQGDAR
jgi:hypothetical protein